MKVLCVFGTRPEAIKMAPVVRELQQHRDRVTTRVCVTAQHREMLDSVLSLFQMAPDYDLDLMEQDQGLPSLTSHVLLRMDAVLSEEKPDWVLVQGDTTTVMATALAAFHRLTKVGHVEAGLRSGNKRHPFPEEINRKIVDHIADLHFAPTEISRQNLLREGVSDSSIHVTGNTGIDALQWACGIPYPSGNGWLRKLPGNTRLVLVTAHRRENFGKPLENICHAVKEIAQRYRDVQIVYPVHLNPNVQQTVRPILDGLDNVTLLPPIDYLTMVHLMKRAHLVLTDSGGLQEEMPVFGVPILVLREASERPEAIAAGHAQLVGTDSENIFRVASRLLDDSVSYQQMAQKSSPFGDGRASERIVRAVLDHAAIA